VKLAAWYFLPIGAAIALVVALTLVFGGFRTKRALATFGEDARMRALMTFNPAKRRGYKGVLLVLAVLMAFFAASQPQYGKGTRLIPATNIDLVIVLDFSKSMYAQDVVPSRIFRAKVEIARLVRQLRGARFAAVAFAGDPIGFPLTADAAAIAQFLRQLEPNDMPVGGTAIARALRYARNLLARDPKSRDHKRVIVLITDGEDLEGNPVAEATNIGNEGTTIHVVHIGGRTAERIPDIDPSGRVRGWRTDKYGEPLLTELSPEGEQQLADVAAATPDGMIIRAEKGSTGLDQITRELKRQMKAELSERVENVYADIYFYPLTVALLLLLIEALLPEAPMRRFSRPPPPEPKRRLKFAKQGSKRRKKQEPSRAGA